MIVRYIVVAFPRMLSRKSNSH